MVTRVATLAFEGIEAAAPEGAHAFEPDVDLVESGGIEALDAGAALGAGADETGFAEDLQMLRDGRSGDGELAHEFTGRAVALGEKFDDATPRGVSQCFEAVHGLEG